MVPVREKSKEQYLIYWYILKAVVRTVCAIVGGGMMVSFGTTAEHWHFQQSQLVETRRPQMANNSIQFYL